MTKEWLTHNSVLSFYDQTKKLGLICDASAYGVGAILFRRIDSEEKLIAFPSRTLSKVEKGYAHIEKKALAVVFGVRKFHKYLFGRKFSIYSDYQPLLGILGHHKLVPAACLTTVCWGTRGREGRSPCCLLRCSLATTAPNVIPAQRLMPSSVLAAATALTG